LLLDFVGEHGPAMNAAEETLHAHGVRENQFLVVFFGAEGKHAP
jgi:hypothetical protein